MNYTQNYHLPQWVKEDRIMMEDFNAMNSSIESGLTRTEGKADTAVSTANEAKQTADAAAAAKPYVLGSYHGDGQSVRDIDVGFRPAAVLVTGTMEMGANTYVCNYFDLIGPSNFPNRAKLTDTGFTVYGGTKNEKQFPAFNVATHSYFYIAFR